MGISLHLIKGEKVTSIGYRQPDLFVYFSDGSYVRHTGVTPDLYQAFLSTDLPDKFYDGRIAKRFEIVEGAQVLPLDEQLATDSLVEDTFNALVAAYGGKSYSVQDDGGDVSEPVIVIKGARGKVLAKGTLTELQDAINPAPEPNEQSDDNGEGKPVTESDDGEGTEEKPEADESESDEQKTEGEAA